MKKFNKTLSIILSVIMILSLFPLTVSAVEYSGTCGENLTWILDKETGELRISGSGDMNNYSGTNTPFYNYRGSITSIYIEDGVTSIGDGVFWDLIRAVEIRIPYGVKTIGKSAFEGCYKLQSIFIPGSVVEIGAHAFDGCKSLVNMTFPNSVTTLGLSVIDGVYSKEQVLNIDYTGTVTEWMALLQQNSETYRPLDEYIVRCIDGVALPSGKCGENLTWILNEAGTLTISGTGDMFSYYGDSAPWRMRTKKVVISEGVTSIGQYAFYDCSEISSVNIPDSVKTIGKSAFEGCYKLQSIFIPGSVVEIGEHAFENCDGLKSITLSTETIGDYAFRDCDSLYAVVCADGVKTIGDYAFYNCNNLYGLKISKSVETLFHSFDACPLGIVYLDNNNKYVTPGRFDFWGEGRSTSKMYYAGTEEEFWEKTSKPTYGSNEHATVYFNAEMHEWGSEIEITCLYVALTCKNCGKKDYCEFAEPTDEHRYIHDVTPPTCTEHGYTQTTCEICDYEYWEYTANPTGHTFNIQDDTPPTCTTHGVTDYECETCGYEYWAYTANPTGHSFGEDGICEICGEKEVLTSHINTQMLSMESVFAMVMNLLAKLFGLFAI